MALEQDAPGEPDGAPPAPQRGAVPVVERPDGEAAEEDAQADGDEAPHERQGGGVAGVDARPLPHVPLPLGRALGGRRRAVAVGEGAGRGAARGPQVHLHDPHAADQHDGRQDRVRVLVEDRVLQVVVDGRDGARERDQRRAQAQRVRARAPAREAGVEHDAGGVDHRQLVDELHRVLERAVEEEAAHADRQVAEEGDEEDGVVAVPEAGVQAAGGEVEEGEVREGVDDLGGVDGGVVVLDFRELLCAEGRSGGAYFFAPV